MDLSIFTITFNSKDLIGQQINSVLKAAEGLEFEHFIIDNGSNDGTVEFIKKEFPHIRLVESKKNLGFAGAHNVAFPLADGKYFLCLNPDMSLQPGSLKKLVDWLQVHQDVGLTSALLLDEKGNINQEATPRRFPTVLNQLAILLKIYKFFPGLLDNYLYKGVDWKTEQEVDTVRGSFMLLKREICDKLGWIFDPRYFLWFDDVDLCREVKKMGLKIVNNPMIGAVDLVGQTFKKQPNLWKQKQFTRSMLQYFQKWSPWYKWIWIWLFRPTAILLVAIFHLKGKKDYL